MKLIKVVVYAAFPDNADMTAEEFGGEIVAFSRQSLADCVCYTTERTERTVAFTDDEDEWDEKAHEELDAWEGETGEAPDKEDA